MAQRTRSKGPEAEWQETVIDLAKQLGWEWLHVRKSIGKGKKWATTTNVVGWPDLLLWHPRRGGQVALELKVTTDPTPEQLAVLESLRASGIPGMVAYPKDLPAVTELLTANRRR